VWAGIIGPAEGRTPGLHPGCGKARPCNANRKISRPVRPYRETHQQMCRVEALMGFVEFTIRAGPAPASASRLTAGCRRADPTHLSYPGSPPGPARWSV